MMKSWVGWGFAWKLIVGAEPGPGWCQDAGTWGTEAANIWSLQGYGLFQSCGQVDAGLALESVRSSDC